MIYDYSKLRGKIVEKYGSNATFADAMGISSSMLSMKINNKIEFKQSEIDLACDLLGIRHKDVGMYFFAK